MKIFELFDKGGKMMDKMRQAVLDIITPLVSQDVPFITVQQVMDGLRHINLGVTIDRGLVMMILDPDEVKSIDRIEGDRIYFSPTSDGDNVDYSEENEEKNKKHVDDMALKQANKNMKDDIPKPPNQK